MAADVASARLPAGTVTLLFSDIERSTQLLEHLGARYAGVLEEHHRIVRAAVAEHGGHEIRTAGDSFFVAFARAGDAVRAAVAIQRGLAVRAWPDQAAVLVRIGLHSGEPSVAGDDYVGIDVHCAARICSAAHGGQIVVSEATERLLADEAITGVQLRDLGEHRLRDLSRPLRLHQVTADGLRRSFRPLRTRAAHDRGRLRLVVDSPEDLTERAPLVREMLAACPDVTIVIASRSTRGAGLGGTPWRVSSTRAGIAISAGGAALRRRASV